MDGDERIRLAVELVGMDQAVAEAKAKTEIVDDMKAEIRFEGDKTNFDRTAAAVKLETAFVGRQRPTVNFSGNDQPFNTVARGVRSKIAELKQVGRNIQTVIAMVNDPFMTSYKIVKNAITSIDGARPTARANLDTAAATRNGNIFSRMIDGLTDKLALVRNLTGGDSSLIRGIGSLASGFVSLGDNAVGAASGLASVGGSGGGAGTALLALGGPGGAAGKAALSIAGLGASAFASALLMGVLVAAIAPIFAIIAVGVATVGALVGGFALLGAAGVKLAKDFGTVAMANRKVENAQIALNEARKSGSSKRVEEAEKALARAQNDQAVALKKAAGNSAEYRKALTKLHEEASLFGPAFKTAFTPAATTLANMTTDTIAYARRHLPALGKAADESLKKLKDGFDSSYKKGSNLEDVLDDLPPIMEDIGETFGNFSSTWMTFMDVALPHVRRFTGWLADASERLAEWADSKKGRDDINDFLELAVPLAESLGDFFKKVGGRLVDLAEDHGPAVTATINFMTEAVESLILVLGVALDIAEALVAAIQSYNNSVNNPTGKKKSGKNPSTPHYAMAEGGDVGGYQDMAFGGTSLYRAASGLSHAGAHFVNDATMMNVGGTNNVLYGEALSGQYREYAFPLDDGWRFITEQPGFDSNSFALWKDLGERKGYFPQNVAAPAAQGPRMSVNPKAATGVVRPSSAGGAVNASLEASIARLESNVVSAVLKVRDATHEVPQGVRESMNKNLEHGRQTRTQVVKGLSREAKRRVFDGTFA